MRIIILILIVLLIGCTLAPKEACDMPITFDRNNFIDWFEADIVPADTSTFTVMAWIRWTQDTGGELYGITRLVNYDGVPAFVGSVFRVWIEADFDRIIFDTIDMTNIDVEGSWHTDTNAVVINTWYHIAFTYDSSDTSNDAVIYINGTSVNVTESITPLAVQTFTDIRKVSVGSIGAGSRFHGTIADERLYTRILAASEIADIYNNRTFDGNDNDLQFHCPMLGAATLQTFEGASLTATTLIVDRINGRKGTPGVDGSNAVGAGEVNLHYGRLQWEEGRGGG